MTDKNSSYFCIVFIFFILQGSLKPGTVLTSSAGTGQVIRIPATQNVVGTSSSIAQLQMPAGRQVCFQGDNSANWKHKFISVNGCQGCNSDCGVPYPQKEYRDVANK
jgi:hypothetical protein